MKKTYFKIGALILLFALMGTGCGEDENRFEKDEDNNLRELDGYIVGFDPCTVNHHYRIGYVIISTDLKDTLLTYNLSDETFKMPASVLLQPSDTLYQIPESYFKNGWGCGFLQASSRYEFKIKGTYRYPKEDEKIHFICNIDVSFSFTPKRVIITSVTK